jgi:hypothetical protein
MYSVTPMSDSIDKAWIGFIDDFNTQLVTTLNYNAIRVPHLQTTTAHPKFFSLLSLVVSRSGS